jgi:hypothetical protein
MVFIFSSHILVRLCYCYPDFEWEKTFSSWGNNLHENISQILEIMLSFWIIKDTVDHSNILDPVHHDALLYLSNNKKSVLAIYSQTGVLSAHDVLSFFDMLKTFCRGQYGITDSMEYISEVTRSKKKHGE